MQAEDPHDAAGPLRRGEQPIALCIVPKPESVSPIANWRARERAHCGRCGEGEEQERAGEGAPHEELSPTDLAARSPIASEETRAPSPARRPEPERDRSHPQDVAGEDRQICW
jgi:hypothetical protein